MHPALATFDRTIAGATTSLECWQALDRLAAAVAGYKLFTVTTVDAAESVASRAYTSDPVTYPVSGTKPIVRDRFFELVHEQHRTFVANTVAEFAQLFPDHATIAALGCGSVVNLPVVLRGVVVATVNMLHEEHHYTPERVAAIEAVMPMPAKLALLAAKALA